jgi:K+-sensing histidine kinase KdpD
MGHPAIGRRSTDQQGSLEFRRYALAGLLLLATVGVQVALNPGPSLAIPLLAALFGVIVTAHLAGRGPAICATAANVLINWYFFAHPRFSFAVADIRDRWSLTIFTGAAIGVSLLKPPAFPHPTFLACGTDSCLVTAPDNRSGAGVVRFRGFT